MFRHATPLLRLVAALVVGTALLGACGEDNKVGDDKLLTFQEEAQKARLGASTTTVAPSTTVATANSTPDKAGIGAAKPTTTAPTTAPPTTAAPATTVPAAKAFEITVNGDNAGTTQFDPSSSRVYVNQVVDFKNMDSVPRSVEADNGAFNSGPIEPGATWTYKATTPGKFNFHDGTRPYAVGSIEVLAR